MTKDEALKLALEALEKSLPRLAPYGEQDWLDSKEAITAIKKALEQPEPKYHRGNRLICLETEEYCVIHISGTDRQWVKFPDSYIGVYTNEQVAELFECREALAQRTWVGLTDEEIQYCVELKNPEAIAEEVEAKLKEKNT